MHSGLREVRKFIGLQYEINQTYCEALGEIRLWPHIQVFSKTDDELYRRVYNAYNRVESKVKEYPDLVMQPRDKDKLIYHISVKSVPEAVNYHHHNWHISDKQRAYED